VAIILLNISGYRHLNFSADFTDKDNQKYFSLKTKYFQIKFLTQFVCILFSEFLFLRKEFGIKRVKCLSYMLCRQQKGGDQRCQYAVKTS